MLLTSFVGVCLQMSGPLIGQDGENVNRLQEESGARLQLEKEDHV